MTSNPTTYLVVPCYNEAARFQSDSYADSLRSDPDLGFVLVNDGSKDSTLSVLRALQESFPDQVSVVDQQPNRGKAEAVRQGILRALDFHPRNVGFWDADLATPLTELPRFLDVLENRLGIQMVFGSRVQLLGRSIQRRPVRHYLGRVFATCVSVMIGLPIYDTQCGAKVLRVNTHLRSLFEEKFSVNWTFDVELIARLVRCIGVDEAEESIFELPLDVWVDVAGSKVGPLDFFRGLLEVWRIYRRYF